MSNTFAEHVADYVQAGWPCVLPVPPETKSPPPVGYTGAEGRDTDAMTLVSWASSADPKHGAASSIALRLPDGVIGIDVDQYEKGGVQKHGAETLAHYLERWGPLPPTWTSTARDLPGQPGGPSRIYLFRVPAQRYATKLQATHPDGRVTGDIEVIQRHHRYAVVWPSVHEKVGGTYTWYDPSGRPSPTPPKPEDLAELPPAWVAGLAEGASGVSAASAPREAGQSLLDQLLDDWRPECADLTSARLQAVELMNRADAGSRHDAMAERTHHLVQLAAAGHTGVAAAILQLRDLWGAITAGEDRAEEFERALLTSARKAVTVVGAVQVPRDPCLLVAGGFPMPPTMAGDPGDSPTVVDENGEELVLQIYEPPRWQGIREVIGAHAFDPMAGLDQPLAEAVLARTYPALRYAYDSDGWLVRAPGRWELHKRLSPWAVAQVAPLMPVGDPEAEKGSEQFERAKRRARFMTAAGASAVAKMMDSLVAGGMHPAAIALSELDSDPEVLWAGGVPWSLRFSDVVPVPAEHVDPATPHLHNAGITPERRPTPLWDDFLATVWPDPEVRAWSLRVLAIALTGYADRALPILIGETGRGKTQVVHLLMSVLGSYAHAADSRLLTPGGENAHASIVYALKGRRLSFIDEGPREGKVAQERLKQLTGGGELTANQMNQNPITFRPSHTVVLTTNDEPPLTDPAVRSRARLIPCDGDPEAVRQARAAIGHVSGTAWRTEAPGVLAAMMAEAAAWLDDPSTGLVVAAPESIRYLAESIGAEQDPISTWVADETEPFEPGTSSSELYQAFTASCTRNNLRKDAIPSVTKWGKALNQLGYPAKHGEHGKSRPLRVRSGGFLPGMGPLTGSDTATRQPTGQPIGQPEGSGANFGAPSDYDAGANRNSGGPLTGPDGLLTGSEPYPSGASSQVNPTVSVNPDGSDGLEQFSTCVHAGAHVHKAPGGKSSQPVSRSVEEAASEPRSTYDPTQATGPFNVDDRPSRRRHTPTEAWRESHARELSERADEVKAPTKAQAPVDPAKTEAARVSRAVKAEEKRLAAIAAASGARVELPALVLRDGSVRHVDLADVAALLATLTEVTVDVEHTGYPIGHPAYALKTVQLGDENFAFVFDRGQADQRVVIRQVVAGARVLHAHSATADLVPLAVDGLLGAEGADMEAAYEEAWSRMGDTVTPAKLADPRSTGSDPSLKKLAAAILGDTGPMAAVSPASDEARAALFKAGKWLTEVDVTTSPERSGWAQVDIRSETMIRYAASDVLDDAAIARRLPPPPPGIFEREQLAQTMTARVALTGLRLDADHVAELRGRQQADLAGATERLAAFGIENPGSDQQVAAAVERFGLQLPRTRTGRPSVAKGVLEPYRNADGPLGELIRARLDYQVAENRLGLFLEGYHLATTQGDGRVRPTVYTMEAKTGRMSCVRPNLQQVPREGGFRACITADPGEVLISADFASVELRVAAALSQDRELAAIITDPERDIHAEIARLVWGPTAGKAERYQAKRKVFGRLYGSGINGLVTADPPVSEPIARAIVDAMDAMTPGLTAWSRSVADGVEAGRSQFVTHSGRVVHLPTDRGYAAPNYCIQGTARELLIDALVRWSGTRWGKAPLLPVHDELVVKVPEADAEEATAALVECMATELHGIPIVAEASEPSYFWKDSS